MGRAKTTRLLKLRLEPRLKNKMKAALYIRVSTQDQSLDLQRTELVAFAEARGWNVVKIYEEKRSGASVEKRPVFSEMMTEARAGKFDILCVWKLDRAFRSSMDCLNNLHALTGAGVQFVSANDAGIDMTTPSGKLLLNLLASFAEFERSLIVSRVTAGVRAKIAKTGKWGPERKRDDAKIIQLRRDGLSVREIAKRAGVSATSVMRSLEALKIAK